MTVESLLKQSSEYTIIEQCLPCSPDGFIPNSVVRIYFAHLEEFKFIFDQSVVKVIERRIMSPAINPNLNFDVTPEPSEIEKTVSLISTQGQIQDNLSYLFNSETISEQTSIESFWSKSKLSLKSSKQEQQAVAKVESFSKITPMSMTITETSTYDDAERVPKKMSKTKSIRIDTIAKKFSKEETKKKPERKASQGSAIKTKRASIASPSKKTEQPVKKRRQSKMKKQASSNIKLKPIKSMISQEISQSVSNVDSEEYPQQPLVKISKLSEAKSFHDKISILDSCPEGEALSQLIELHSGISDQEDILSYVEMLNHYMNSTIENNMKASDVNKLKDVIVDMSVKGGIDVALAADHLRKLIELSENDRTKLDVLCSLIHMQGNVGDYSMKEILLEILPFLANDDETIKEQAFEMLKDFTQIDTKDELREMLVELDVLRDTAQSDDIDVVTDGRILNVQYWKKMVNDPTSDMAIRYKSSEEIQITSEVEISINKDKIKQITSNASIRTPAPSTAEKFKNSHNFDNRSTTFSSLGKTSDLGESEVKLSQVSFSDHYPSASNVLYLSGPRNSLHVVPSEEIDDCTTPEIEIEEYDIKIPEVDIKRKILSPEQEEIVHKQDVIGKLKERGKVFASSDDLLMWFKDDEGEFYDPSDNLVGSLLPSGDIMVPQDLNLAVTNSIVDVGKELLKYAGNCDGQGRIRNRNGEIIGKLTRNGELISKQGLIFDCNGTYAGKQCFQANRMYINGEIFDPENRYWGHIGPDNSVIHLSGTIYDAKGIRIGNIGDYGVKLSSCINLNDDPDDTIYTDSGVSMGTTDKMMNKSIYDNEGRTIAKFKNKDTIITTCGDMFDRGGVYIGQMLASGHIMMKEEAIHIPTNSNGRGSMISRGKGKPSSTPRLLSRRGGRPHKDKARSAEIGEEWEKITKEPYSHSAPDQGYGSEDKLLFDLAQSVPQLPTITDVRGQRLVKTITFSRANAGLQSKNFHIEPMPSTLNAHTTSQNGNTNFGVLKVDWTTKSFDPDVVQRTLPPIKPPPSVMHQHPAMKDSSPLCLPHISKEPRRHRKSTSKNSTNCLMKLVTSYLKKELQDDANYYKIPFKSDTKSMGVFNVCNTPSSPRRG